MNCLFCNIIAGQIPARLRHTDEKVLAFDDIHPQAPHHILIVPKRHIATVNDLQPDDNELVGHMIQTAKHLATDLKIAEPGFRLVMNCNASAGQTVFHIHLHLLGGRPLQWPPG